MIAAHRAMRATIQLVVFSADWKRRPVKTVSMSAPTDLQNHRYPVSASQLMLPVGQRRESKLTVSRVTTATKYERSICTRGNQKLGMVTATLLSFDTSLDIAKQARQEFEIEGCKNKRNCYTAQSACLQPQQFSL
jgi:hypothetical protein